MQYSPTITFVTAFLDLGEDRSKDKSVETCLQHFRAFAGYGCKIALYTSESYQEMGMAMATQFPNVQWMGAVNLQDTWTDKTIQSYAPGLPTHRTGYHDTRNFMSLMNAKLEFVSKAIHANPFQTTHYAWIDFSIHHVIKHPQDTFTRLFTYAHSDLKPRMLVFPACWSKEDSIARLGTVAHQIHWRFCGGFFVGDRESLLDTYSRYQTLFPRFLETYGTLVWEVNLWAWMEQVSDWCPESYLANHDDSILRIPSQYLEVDASLTTIPPRQESCRLAIDSLLPQVRHIYLNVAKEYKRFGTFQPPAYLLEEPYKSRVRLIVGEDKGPATKYLGGLAHMTTSPWIFFCDDDQEYHPDLLQRMKDQISHFAAYQNRYEIVRHGSGGIIHGYVGVLGHLAQVRRLLEFPLPEAAQFVDDQWMSLYCWMHNVPIRPTGIEAYKDIFKVLQNGHEKMGAASLASLGNRAEKVQELGAHFGVVFAPGGLLVATNKIDT